VDNSSAINLLAAVPLSSLEMVSALLTLTFKIHNVANQLRHDAQKSLEILDQSVRDPFTELFLKEQRNLCSRFDTVIRSVSLRLAGILLTGSVSYMPRVDLSAAKERDPDMHSILDWGSPYSALLASLSSFLRRGLGNRTRAIAILHATSELRSMSQAHPANPTVIQIGLIHDPENAFRLVDYGPSADEVSQPAAEQFRNFWGKKAELRRFKDGRIVESVVWDVKTSDERSHIPSLIVRHILGKHFGVAGDAIQTFQATFDSVLRLPESVARYHQASSMSAGFKAAMAAFDHLVKVINALGEELPLAVLNVSPSSEYLRYTSVFSPVPASPISRFAPLMEVVLEFEKSAKWPDDLGAIQHMKLAFFERIATSLMGSIPGLKATVVVGERICGSETQDQARLEIVTSQGWAFSARIWHDREATLLDRIIHNRSRILPHVVRKDERKTDGREYRQALEAREIYARRFIHGPRHHRAIASLCHRFSAYAGTVRLVKRWLASHWLLHGHVTEEAVEIICASFFVGNSKETTAASLANVPGSKERGFSMVVEFLKERDWVNGIVVPLYGHLESAITLNTPMAWVTSGVWRLSTEVDKEGHVWTSRGPDVVAANRIRALAQATWVQLQGMEDGSLDVKV
jgi:U3 small nucleolar RNA-associated protein 22